MREETDLRRIISTAIANIYKIDLKIEQISIVPTKKEYVGDYTFVTYPLAKKLGLQPTEISKNISDYITNNYSNLVSGINIVGGFINLTVDDGYLINELQQFSQQKTFFLKKNKTVLVEFPSPNTNKPLHLGHLRNMFLGVATSNILEAYGYDVKKVNIVNNRGVHICKSMLAYVKYGNGETPRSTNTKGDHFVGKYYVKFETEYKKELETCKGSKSSSKLLSEVQEMLNKWEKGDKETIDLWKKMNNWVYEGFAETFKYLNINFDKTYYESDTYLLGKESVLEGLKKEFFYKKEDGSVWINLQDAGLDEKLVLRADGTSVYITQDIGTADIRYTDFNFDKCIYIVGNEQDYHFKVLFKIIEKLGRPFHKNMHHLSYGMVDLPDGKMKSREGTVIDADHLMHEMYQTAKKHTEDLGKIKNFTSQESQNLYKIISLSALKYFLLKVDPKKRILFDSKSSIDFQGDTGPFIQYTYARISSLLEKAAKFDINTKSILGVVKLEQIEKDLIIQLLFFPKFLKDAGENLSPAYISQYVFDLAKIYNKFYSEIQILNSSDKSVRSFRLFLSRAVSQTIKYCLFLLGIEAPKKM